MIPAKNLMLDIETLSTKPDAAVFEIALVEFTRHGMCDDHLNICFVPTTGDVDAATVKWWFQRSEPCSLTTATMPEEDAVRRVVAFMERRKDYALWAQSPAFDCIILQSLLQRRGSDIPIGFREWRDVRTVRELGDWPKVGYRVDGHAHTAFDDCLRQIDTLLACWEGMK